MRMIVGFDPSKAQAALADLRDGIAPGVEWRVLNLDQNPHGVEPSRSVAGAEEDDEHPSLLERVTGWLGKDDDEEQHARVPAGGLSNAYPDDPFELTEAELDYLRTAPARAGTVLVVTAPEAEAAAVRMWFTRHSGFSLAPGQSATDGA